MQKHEDGSDKENEEVCENSLREKEVSKVKKNLNANIVGLYDSDKNLHLNNRVVKLKMENAFVKVKG